MQRPLSTFLVLSFGILALRAPAFAHHGTSVAYDSQHPITLKATVTEFAFANPHVQIYFDVKDDQGNVAHWGCETASPGRLIRSGWPRNAVKAGDQITITVYPAKSGAHIGDLRKVVLPDGSILGPAQEYNPGQK
jgi:Family of unknown function (DUF6152)